MADVTMFLIGAMVILLIMMMGSSFVLFLHWRWKRKQESETYFNLDEDLCEISED